VIAAVAPETLRPTDLAEARDAMVDAGRGRSLVIRGAGTKATWGAPSKPALVVDTTALTGVVAHDPADATATVRAGTPLAELQGHLAEAGQWLAVDPPHPDATVGGTFAANDSGPRRQRYGTLRDLVIGVTLVTSDGAVARSGGNVIKNVAGYDLAKLLCGSLGTLGLVTEVTVRLHPLPQVRRTVTADVDADAATAVVLDLLASPLVISAVDWHANTLAVWLEGRPAGVADQTRALHELLTRHGAAGAEADDGDAVWDAMAAGHAGEDGDTVVRAATLPSDLPAAASAFQRCLTEAGAEGTLTSHVGLGLHTARLTGGDADSQGRFIAAWRSAVAAVGGHVVVRRRLPQLADTATIWGPDPSAVALMRSVKAQLDPDRRCAPGRYVGGI